MDNEPLLEASPEKLPDIDGDLETIGERESVTVAETEEDILLDFTDVIEIDDEGVIDRDTGAERLTLADTVSETDRFALGDRLCMAVRLCELDGEGVLEVLEDTVADSEYVTEDEGVEV